MLLKLQFVAALLVAAGDALRQQAVGLWAALRTKQQVPETLAKRRMAFCKGCPIFSPFLATCGTPFRRWRGPGIRPGCLCFMPKASLTKHVCWLVENKRPGGWPVDLRG